MTTESFQKDVLPLKHPIFRYALYMMKNKDDAQDVTQEVLIKIWEKREELYQVKNLRAWAMTITRNKCLDLLKSTKGDFYSLEENLDAAQTVSPYEKMQALDESNLIKDLLEKLPSMQKEVFYLRHFEEDSYKEIGDTLNIDENKVKVYLHRARTFIKKSLEEKHNYGLKTG